MKCSAALQANLSFSSTLASETDRERGRETVRERVRQTDGQTERGWGGRQADREMER